MIVAVTGHRPNKLGGYRTPNPTYNAVMEGLDKALLDLRPDRVILGMALGVDQWMADLCLFNGIPYTAAIPFEGFDGRWPESSKHKYRQLLQAAAEVVVVCGGEYEPWKMQRRNEWMVDNCDHLLAVYDGTTGGTANCIRYARDIGKAVLYVQYQPPPPIVARERPVQAVLRPAETLSGVPVEQRQAAEDFLRRFTARTEQNRQGRPESEGQRAARRRALEELRRDTGTQEIGLDDLVAIVGEATQQALDRTIGQSVETTAEEKKDEGPLVREFSRFVDLDV